MIPLRSPGPPGSSRRLSPDDPVPQRTDPGDCDLHDVAVLEPPLRAAGHAYPARRAREDHVARLEREPLRQVRDQVRDVEDELVRVRALQGLAVDARLDVEMTQVELVRGDERRAEWAERVERLRPHPLPGRELVVPG